jgi:hypothetical protein
VRAAEKVDVTEVDGQESLPLPPPPDPSEPRRRGGGVPRGLVLVVLVLLLSLGDAVLAGPGPWRATAPPVVSTAPPQDAVPQDRVSAPPPVTAAPDRPLPGLGVTTVPRGRPLPAPPGGGPHAFVSFQQDGATPVGYDPCRLVHYVIRPDHAPPGGEELVHAAIARISEVTGLVFVHDGPTDEAPSRDREIYQPDRYGERWAPVLVAWETEEQNPALAGDIVGEGGSVAVSLGDGPRIYLTGTVSLDAPRFAELLTDGERTAARAIVLHEFGHVVGLAHVDDATQLMYREARRGMTDFAAGDLTGLARLGSGPCVPEL